MGVRVRVRVSIGGRLLETVALVNSGFEADRPQILVPYRFLSANGVGLEALGRPILVEYDTAGGLTALNVFSEACTVSVVEGDRESRSTVSDLVVSPVEREVLLNDALTEELGIVILSPRSGLWRFYDDPPDKVRYSYRPQYW